MKTKNLILHSMLFAKKNMQLNILITINKSHKVWIHFADDSEANFQIKLDKKCNENEITRKCNNFLCIKSYNFIKQFI